MTASGRSANMSPRLRQANCLRYEGTFRYLVAYDFAAGLPDRYTVMVLNADDPVTIGRELPLDAVRSLIQDYEADVRGVTSYGDRGDVLWARDRVNAMRLKKCSPKKPKV